MFISKIIYDKNLIAEMKKIAQGHPYAVKANDEDYGWSDDLTQKDIDLAVQNNGEVIIYCARSGLLTINCRKEESGCQRKQSH